MAIELIGTIANVETIAVQGNIRILSTLQKRYGKGRWRKLKGTGLVRLTDGSIHRAELHWFEAHGIGKKKLRIKRLLG